MMQTKLDLITDICKRDPESKINNIAYLLNAENLKECFYLLKKNKAAGVDGVTFSEYETNLDANISDLVERMKRQTYKPQPVLRVYIPKSDGKQRPLGIPSLEDKIVQKAMTRVLESIYELEFLNFSYGFRANRSCHQALQQLSDDLNRKPINHVIDADIKGFFDNVDHGWLIKFLEHRISDTNFIRLIKRFLRNGYMEECAVKDVEMGTPQGGIISPILANIYLHYVLDLWVSKTVKSQCEGEIIIVRYADDFVIGAQKIDEARDILQALKERMKKFNLELSESKTRLIEFGKFSNENSTKRKIKQATFNFLGFTHFVTKSKSNKFKVGRKTEKKRFARSVSEINIWFKSVRNLLVIKDIWKLLRAKMRGHIQYYGVSENYVSVKRFCKVVKFLTMKWMNRRSQKKSFNYETFLKYLKLYPLPEAKIHHNFYGSSL
jgi:group II intron reverse transcriptase/maturase